MQMCVVAKVSVNYQTMYHICEAERIGAWKVTSDKIYNHNEKTFCLRKSRQTEFSVYKIKEWRDEWKK